MAKRLSLKVTCLFLVLLFSSCQESEKLKELDRLQVIVPEYAPLADIEFCNTPTVQNVAKIKFMFVLDKSGSNQQRSVLLSDGTYSLVSGTDVDGKRRYDPILAFMGLSDVSTITSTLDQNDCEQRLANTPFDENTFMSLVNFSTSYNVPRQFTNNHCQFINAVINEKIASGGAPDDGGWTNYESVLHRIEELIVQDVRNEQALNTDQIVSSHYVIFFITDGAPVIDKDLEGNLTIQSKSAILNMVNNISSLSEYTINSTYNDVDAWVESVQVHTGYYYSPIPTAGLSLDPSVDVTGYDAVAFEYLNDIAVTGRGQVHTFSGDSPIDFNSFRLPGRRVEYVLNDVILVNMSTLWEQGQLVKDSDGDGLSDAKELVLGSNPLLVDSDHDGLSDAVEYYRFGSPIGNNGTTCGGSEKVSDLDKDGLNACEERVLGSRADSADSNFDGIPDDLALRYGFFISIADGTDSLTDKDHDGRANYHELKYDTPQMFNNDRIHGLTEMTYDRKNAVKQADTTCYSYEVDKIKKLSSNDILKVYVSEKTVLREKYNFKRSSQNMNSSSVIYFTDDMFE